VNRSTKYFDRIAAIVRSAALGASATRAAISERRPRRRSLSAAEQEYLGTIFADSVDTTRIQITRFHPAARFSATTIGNTVHLQRNHFAAPTGLDLSNSGTMVLVHEVTHVWQFQHGGWAYIPLSLIAQLQSWVRTGSRNGAYDWHTAQAAARPWPEWNPEQQAAAVESFARLRDPRTRARPLTPESSVELTALEPVIRSVRTGTGAPGLRIALPRHRR
jgi:hypothetical protein